MTTKSDTLPRSGPALRGELAKEGRAAVALRDVAIALGKRLEIGELLAIVLEKMADALGADDTMIYLLDEAGTSFVERVVRGAPPKELSLPVGDDILGRVAKLGDPVRVPDEDASRAVPAPRHDGGSVVAVPMKNHEGKTIGVALARSRTGGGFTQADTDVLAAMAAQAVIAKENARLVLSLAEKNGELLATAEKLERHVRDLRLLFDLERAMVRAETTEEVFLSTLTKVMAVVSTTRAAIALVDADFDPDNIFAIDAKQGKLTRLASNDYGLIDHAIRHHKTIASTDLPHDHRGEERGAAKGHVRGRAGIAVPLEGEHGRTVGAIALYDKVGGGAFSEDDKELLRLIAANIGTVLQLQKAREAREREDRLSAIGRLLSGVIHDLKTPLTIISGYMQLMQHDCAQDERDRYVDLALKQFDYISAMQRDVLEFARGEKSILVRKVYLQRFFDEVRSQLSHQLARHHVELVVELQERLVARFDESKMTRLVHNLARNAMEAMGEDGGRFTIRVRKEPETDMLVFTFTDTGPGIPREIEKRLFESFVTSGKSGGTGLGLAIVKQIVEEHGGEVSVTSTNKGATFTVRIPQV